MTAVLDRPTETGGGVPARRAVLRWALRLFRREWRQQILVLTLITVAVAATIFGAALGTNLPLPANAGFGSANALVNLPGDDPHLASEIAALRGHFGTVDVIENQVFATGLVTGAQLRAQNPDGAYGRPTLALVRGHYPHGPGEVDLTSGLASLPLPLNVAMPRIQRSAPLLPGNPVRCTPTRPEIRPASTALRLATGCFSSSTLTEDWAPTRLIFFC